jgi:hypothetical protein
MEMCGGIAVKFACILFIPKKRASSNHWMRALYVSVGIRNSKYIHIILLGRCYNAKYCSVRSMGSTSFKRYFMPHWFQST